MRSPCQIMPVAVPAPGRRCTFQLPEPTSTPTDRTGRPSRRRPPSVRYVVGLGPSPGLRHPLHKGRSSEPWSLVRCPVVSRMGRRASSLVRAATEACSGLSHWWRHCASPFFRASRRERRRPPLLRSRAVRLAPLQRYKDANHSPSRLDLKPVVRSAADPKSPCRG